MHRKNSPSMRKNSTGSRPRASNSSGIGLSGTGVSAGKSSVIEPSALRCAGSTPPRVWNTGRVTSAVSHSTCALGERRVSAQRDFDFGCEPAEVIVVALGSADESGLGVFHLGRELLHPCRLTVPEHDCRGIATERRGGERVDDEYRQAHPSARTRSAPGYPSPSCGTLVAPARSLRGASLTAS